jgi:trimeric autotransporter adhesin
MTNVTVYSGTTPYNDQNVILSQITTSAITAFNNFSMTPGPSSAMQVTLNNGIELTILGTALNITGGPGAYVLSGDVTRCVVMGPTGTLSNATNGGGLLEGLTTTLAGLFDGTLGYMNGADTVTGSGALATALYGYGGDDVVTAGPRISPALTGIDTLYGGTGNDTLLAFLHDDVVVGQTTYPGSDSGNDVIFGGDGEDTLLLNWSNRTTDAQIDLGFLNTAPTGIESLAFYDTRGNLASAIMLPGQGLLTLAGVTDVEGLKTLTAASAGTINLSALSFTVTGADFTFFGSIGNDIFIAPEAVSLTTGSVIYNTGTGNDRITGGLMAEVMLAGDGTDTLSGGVGADDMFGGNDADAINGDAGADTLTGDAGDDTLMGGADSDTLYGSDNADSLVGGTGDDLIYGDDLSAPDEDSGNDTLVGGTGADTLIGGDGDDTYVADADDTVVDLNGHIGGTDTLQRSITTNLAAFANIENLVLLGTTAIDGAGDAFNNRITGNTAANYLSGGGGLDTLAGGAGDDTYLVGAGVTVVEAQGAGRDTALSFGTLTLATNVENLTLLGTVAANLTGNGLANRITGNDAANILNGGALADTLIGYGGDDTYIYGAGDVIVEFAGGGTDTVISATSLTLAANFENLELNGFFAFNGTGNNLANRITGNNASNGIDGGLGADTMSGGAGNDVYFVQDARDVVIEFAEEMSSDVVHAKISYTLQAGVEIESFDAWSPQAKTNINLTGNAFSQYIRGNAGANIIAGGAGSDSVSGGAGSDTFMFNTALNGDVDRIFDFSHIADTIRLENAIFRGLGTTTGTLNTNAFWKNATGVAHDTTDRIIYNTATGVLTYDSNGSAAGGTVAQFAVLSLPATLDFTDFVIS